MATSVITDSAFRTACAECKDAIDLEQWAVAYKKYAGAEAINAAFERSVSDDAAQVIRRESLSGLKSALDACMAISLKFGDNRRMLRTSRRSSR